MQKLFGQAAVRSLVLNLSLALVSVFGLCGAAPASATPTSAPLADVSFMPIGTTWLLTLHFHSASGGKSDQDAFFKNTIERRPGFRRLQKQIEKVLGVNISSQIKTWWIFGTAHAPKGGTSVIDSSVSAGKITAQLQRNADKSRDSYDGITIYRINYHAKHRRGPGLGPTFVAVVKPGIILGSLSEKLLEQSLDCHLRVKKSVSPHSHLFSGWNGHDLLYFSVVHLQRAIDAAQNPLMVPPQIRAVKSIHLMVVSVPKAVRIHGYLHMLSAKAAIRSAAQLKALKKLAYHANSGANATDRQMVLAGAILRLKINSSGHNVQFNWRIPYALLLRLGPPHKRGG